MHYERPVVFTDLDDTLFQTSRKMDQAPYAIGAFDRSGNPRSFFNKAQYQFLLWLLNTTDLIPVTARGTEEIARVNIPFQSWQITTHGAVILTPEGNVDLRWKSRICQSLISYETDLLMMVQLITEWMAIDGVNAWARLNFEYGVPVYLIMKHCDSYCVDQLYSFATSLPSRLSAEGINPEQFYIHQNDNNIAWIPHSINKGEAVLWLIDQLHEVRGDFPLLGMGDSISDYCFMRHCCFFTIPQQSQLTTKIIHPGVEKQR